DPRDDERLHAATRHRLLRITVGPQSNVNPPQSTLSERSALKKLSQAAAAYLPWQNGQPLVTDIAAAENVMWPSLFHFGRGDFFEDVLYSVLLSDSLTPSSTGVESESFGRTPVTSSNCGLPSVTSSRPPLTGCPAFSSLGTPLFCLLRFWCSPLYWYSLSSAFSMAIYKPWGQRPGGGDYREPPGARAI
ncbi:hypothetical protein D917_05956, partial [Trichinella nativa]